MVGFTSRTVRVREESMGMMPKARLRDKTRGLSTGAGVMPSPRSSICVDGWSGSLLERVRVSVIAPVAVGLNETVICCGVLPGDKSKF